MSRSCDCESPREMGNRLQQPCCVLGRSRVWYTGTMRRWILPAALLALACQVSPVVTPPSRDSRYEDCRRASRDYCKHVLSVSDDEKDKCMAQRAFECLSGGSQ